MSRSTRNRLAVACVLMLGPAATMRAEKPYKVAWTSQFGSPAADVGISVAVSPGGDTYVAGWAGATFGTPVNAYAGGEDALLSRQDGAGNRLWHTFVGSSSLDRGRDVALDAAGNAYVAGYADATFGSPINAYAGGTEAFVARYDASGVRQWVTFAGSSSREEANAVAVDAAGNVYVTGIAGATFGSPVNPHAGGRDVFVAKFDASGVRLWHTFYGSRGSEYSQDVAVDAAGNVYVIGYDMSAAQVRAAGDGERMFLAKFDTSGSHLWVTFLGSPAGVVGGGLALDAAGNIYVAGRADATFGTPVSPHAGEEDGFLCQYDASSGVLQWNTFIGTGENDMAHSVAVDAAGDVFVSGQTYGDLGRTNAGDSDVFVSKFDAAGNRLWVDQRGTSARDAAASIATDAEGNIYVCGVTYDALGGPHQGDADVFLVKYAVPEPATISLLALGVLAAVARKR